MPRILHLIPTLAGGGAERQLSMLAAEQVRRGWVIHVGIRQGGVYEESLRNSDVVVHLLGDYEGPNPLLLARINRLIRQVKPDVVHTWLPQMDIVGGIAALWNSVPWIVCERTIGLAFQCIRLQAWFRWHLARYASAVVANSWNGAAYWRARMPADARIVTIANAVDVAAIRNAVSSSGGHSNSHGSTKDILVVGRLAPEKALEIIVQAAFLVPVEQNIRVLIIGDGPLREEIAASIRETALGDRICLLPMQPSWWGMLQGAIALVSMSRFEGQPNVVLEAMAAGCPLIVSDIPAHREFLDEESAILISPNNPDALAEAITSLLSDPVSADLRAKRASGLVEDLTIQQAADAYESVYEEVASGREKQCAES